MIDFLPMVPSSQKDVFAAAAPQITASNVVALSVQDSTSTSTITTRFPLTLLPMSSQESFSITRLENGTGHTPQHPETVIRNLRPTGAPNVPTDIYGSETSQSVRKKVGEQLNRFSSKKLPAFVFAILVSYPNLSVPSPDEKHSYMDPIITWKDYSTDQTWGPDAANSFLESRLASKIYDDLTRTLASAETEEFNDGYESELSRRLSDAIAKYHGVAFSALTSLFSSAPYSVDVVSEALKTLGTIDDLQTRMARGQFLIDLLKDPSAVVRDAAGVGLADLAYKEAIPYLRFAVEVEQNAILQKNLHRIIQLLEV